MRNHERKAPAPQRGIAAVEFAIALPLLLLLMLGSAELGRAFYQYNTLTKAVRDGARYLSANALNGAKVIDIDAATEANTQNLVVYGNTAGTGDPLLAGLDADDVTVTLVDVNGASHVQITATHDYEPISPVIPTFGLGAGDIDVDSMQLQASITMRPIE